jgi:hypothetical protein
MNKCRKPVNIVDTKSKVLNIFPIYIICWMERHLSLLVIDASHKIKAD